MSYSFGGFELFRKSYHIIRFELLEAEAANSIEVVTHYLLFSEMHGLETVILINHRLKYFLPPVEVSDLLDVLSDPCTIAKLFEAVEGLLLESVAPKLV